MKWITVIFLAAISLGNFNDIAKVNRLKSEAQKSYLAGDFKQAIEKYGILIDSFQITEPEVLMNYANAAYLATSKGPSPTAGLEGPANTGTQPTQQQAASYQQIAQQAYTSIAQTGAPALQSKAFNQLGVIAFHSSPTPQPSKEALTQAQNLFKSALMTDQNNQQARFNYELVTKMLEQQQDQEQEQDQQQDKQDQEQEQQQDQQDQQQDQEQQQNQDQQNQDQQNQDQQQDQEQQDQQGEQENSDQQQGEPEESESQDPEEQQSEDQSQEQPLNASPEKMEELKISEEKARMILEAMKNSEVQYIQQNQKKATKRPESGKPDW